MENSEKEIQVTNACLIFMGEGRLRYDELQHSTDCSMVRYYPNGERAGVSFGTSISPTLPDFWAKRVTKIVDFPSGYTVFSIEPNLAKDLIALNSEKSRLVGESWNLLEKLRSDDHNIWDFRTSSILYLEITTPKRTTDDESITHAEVLKYLAHWSDTSAVAQRYSHLTAGSASHGNIYEQLFVFNTGSIPYTESDALLIPEFLFHVLELMNASRIAHKVKQDIESCTFYKKSVETYFNIIRRSDINPIDTFSKMILGDIEKWMLQREKTTKFISELNSNSRIDWIRSEIREKNIIDCSPGQIGPREIYNFGVLTSLESKLETTLNKISSTKSTGEEKRNMIMAVLAERVSLQMHNQAMQLSRNAVIFSILAVLIGILGLVS